MAEEKKSTIKKTRTKAVSAQDATGATSTAAAASAKPSASKPAVSAVSRSRATREPVVAKKTPSRRRSAQSALGTVAAEERYRMIQDAAYYRAEKRGFAPGHDLEDWAEAEREVDALLAARHAG